MSIMIGIQIVFAFLMYFGTFISYYLPIRLFSKTVNNRVDDLNSQLKLKSSSDFDQEEKERRIYSHCNCIATGIFIAMCFMNVPMVNDEFNNFLKEANLVGITYPLSEVTILLGFFMVLFFEQLIIKFKSNHSHAPFLHLDDEEINDEQQCKLLEESLSSEGVSIDQTSQSDGQYDQENRLETSELSSDVIEFKSRDQFKKRPPNKFHSVDHHTDFHNHHFNLNEFNNDINLGFFMLIFASSVHSIFEGLALGLVKQYNKAISLFIGIFLHECIIAVALGINAAQMQHNKSIMFGLIFSATIPLGILFGVLIGYTPGAIGKLISATFQGLATGTFLQVAFYELFPTEINHNQHPDKLLKKISLMFIGFLIMAFITLISN